MESTEHRAAAADLAAAARSAFRSGDMDRAERACRLVMFHETAAQAMETPDAR